MKKILFLLAASFFAFQLNCLASIDVTHHSGTIEIIPAGGGAPITINAGQPIPPIPDGSTIQIITGSLSVATTSPDTVLVKAGGNSIDLPSNSSIKISLNSNGAVRVSDAEGTVGVKTADGNSSSIGSGSTIVIAGNTIRDLKNAEGYTPPTNTPGPGVNTQVQFDNGGKDISPTS